MKVLLLICLTGCTHFSVKQLDKSFTIDGTPEREISTELSGTAWFSSAQHLTGIKAITTDKTQSFGTSTFGQQGATNSVEALKALARIAEAVKPP